MVLAMVGAPDLLRHMEWADALVWGAVQPAWESDARLKNILRHLHAVQWAFLSVWRGRDIDAADLSNERDLTALQTWARSYHRQAATVMHAFDEQTLNSEAHVPWSAEVSERFGMPAHPVTVGETIVQVAMHSQYHRGQANTRIRELGGEPPLIDFIMWVWRGKPAAEWR